MRTVIVALLTAALGLGLGAYKWRGNIEHWHRLGRMQALVAHAEQMPPGPVLVIGDSITEMVRFDTLCGKPAVNAGISQATSETWASDAKRLIDAYKPSLVVLALGTNDKGDWHSDYRSLAKLADYAVEPRDPEKAAFVRSVVRSVPSFTDSSDGIHPTAKGARQWLANVEKGCLS